MVDNALPSKRNVTALEEAEYEEDEGDSFAKHSMLQCKPDRHIDPTIARADHSALDKMRTYRPRILVHGSPGMGQAWLGPAILHHLEGFHVQTLDLGTLMGDSSRVSTPRCHLFETRTDGVDGRVRPGAAICRGQATSALRHLHPVSFAMGFCYFRYCPKHYSSFTRWNPIE